MESLQVDNAQLVLGLGQRVVRVDLARAVRARMWNRSETRPCVVNEFEVARIDHLADGLRVMLVNHAEGLFIPVIFRPAPDGLRVTVPAGEICELNGINRKLMELDLLPELVTSRVGQAGWFLLPCFSGVLVEFKDHAAAINRDRLYMDQAEWEKLCLMNCFAANVAGEGVLAIVHRGDFFCHVTTEINQAGVNRIYPSFGLRHRDSEPIAQEDKELILHFAGGPQAEWPALAHIYRDYLVRERGVVPLKARLAENPILAYSVSAMRVKIFMGIKHPGVPDGSSPLRVDTTFEQAEAILDRMKASGIGRAVVTLVGWNLGGHDGAYPQRFPVEPALGGEEGLRKLIVKAKGLGYQIVPHDNLTDMYMAGQTYDPEVVLRHEDNTPVLGGIWGGGRAVKACPVAYFDRYGLDVTRIKDLGFEGHYYCDAQSNPLFRCHDPRHPADEEQFGLSQCKLTQAYRVLYGAVSQELSPAYALPFIDEAASIACPGSTEALLHICPETFRRLVSRLVPFYSVAVHGLITYQDGWVHGYRQLPGGVRQGWLRALSYGARPCMHVSWTGAYDAAVAESLNDIGEPYRIAFEELASIHAERIEAFETLAPEASRVTYANGCSVAVNWGRSPVGDLPALSHHITKPNP